MNFLAPAAAGLAALSIPIILMYMLRLRRTEMAISSTFLWQHLVHDREANAPWQRLKWNWLLLLQLLILLALVLALMRPFLTVDTPAAGRVVLLLDASASMNATDVADGRFEQAKDAAIEVVNRLGNEDTMTVIRVGEVPEVLVSASSDKPFLRSAIRGATVGEGQADWSAAMTLAAAGGRGAENLNVVLVSDGGIGGRFPEIPGDLRLIPMGESGQNAAISALATRQIPGEGQQLFAQITNYGDQDMDVILSLTLDDSLFSAERYSVAAGQRTDVVVNDLPRFDAIQASLSLPAAATIPDYLALDDRAYAVGNASRASEVLLVTPRNLFLSQIFASLPGSNLTVVTPEQGLPVRSYDVYIFDGWLSPRLPSGDLFLINPPSSLPGLFSLTGVLEDLNLSAVQSTAPDHPITQYLDFENINIRRFGVLSGYETWGQVLIQAEGGPLLLAGQRDSQQIAVLTFALQDSDLPLQIAFPILISNLMGWYTPPRALVNAEAVLPGQAVVIRPLQGDNVRVILPDGSDEILAVSDSPDLIFGQTAQKGIYQVEVRAGEEVLSEEFFAVNLFDAGESQIAPQTSVTVGTLTLTENAQAQRGQWELWQYLAGAGLLILLLEWIYYHRTGMRQLSARLPYRRAARS
jgi:hypothetical protein